MTREAGSISFGRKLELDRFRPSGFDYLRLGLAIAVVVSHGPTIAEGEQAGIDLFRGAFALPLKVILPAFFALSGFLVAGSMERSRTLLMFIGLRVIRIYPALIVEVILSALLIGPFVTVLPLHEYFTSKLFLRYLVNVTGHISFYLPGVFVHNPKPDMVNYQLWTVPWELMCYISLALLIFVGLKTKRYFVLLGIAGLTCAYLVKAALRGGGDLDVLQGHIWGPVLVLYFLTGVFFYLYRDLFPWNWKWCVAAAALAAISITLLPGGQYLAMFPLVYTTVFLGLCNPRRYLFIGMADYSYGIYLYGYVLQQLVAFLLPFTRTWYLNVLFALPLSVLAGMVSWYAVERPALKLRGHVKDVETKWLAWRAGTDGRPPLLNGEPDKASVERAGN